MPYFAYVIFSFYFLEFSEHDYAIKGNVRCIISSILLSDGFIL